MRNVRPNSPITTILRGAPEGIEGDLTVSILSAEDGSVVTAADGTGIVEIAAPSGNYAKGVTMPSEVGTYLIQWNHDDVEILDDEVYQVTTSGVVEPVDPGNAYASRSDLEAYLEDGLPAGYTDEYFDRVLHLASLDVDRYASAWFYHADSDHILKFYKTTDPDIEWRPDIDSRIQNVIVRATCAQAEYRLAKGDQFFVEKQRAEGEFSGTQVYQPRFGPKAEEEFRMAGFMVRVQTATLR